MINKNSKVRRQRDPIPWKYCVLTVVCGLILVGGFFAAARQHFSAVGVAMENAELRVRISNLKDEKRKLLLSKERASSPVRIASLAKSIGFSTMPRPVIVSTETDENKSASQVDNKPVYSYAVSKDEKGTEGTDRSEPELSNQKDKKSKQVKIVEKKPVIDNQVAALRGNEIIKNLR